MKHIDGNLALDENYFGSDSLDVLISENEAVVYNKELDKKKARRRRIFDAKAKNKLKRLSKIGGYPSPAFPVDVNGRYTDDADKIVYYKRIVCSGNNGGVGKWLQRITNKRFRKNTDIAPKGNGYRRCFDKMWELF